MTAAHIAARPGAECSAENIGRDFESRKEEVKSEMLLAAVFIWKEKTVYIFENELCCSNSKKSNIFICVTKSMIIIISNNNIFIFHLILFSTM